MSALPPRDHLQKQIATAMGWLKEGSLRDLEVWAVLSHCEEQIALDATELERLNGLLAGDPKIISMHMENGEYEISSTHWAVGIIAASLLKSLGEAPNYITMEVKPRGEVHPIEVTVRRSSRTSRTPAQDLNELRAVLKGYEQWGDSITGPDNEWRELPITLTDDQLSQLQQLRNAALTGKGVG